MTRTVLLTLDRSEKDARAIPVAEAFAALVDGNIHSVHVGGSESAGASASPAPRETPAERWLAERRAHIRAPSGREVTAEVLVGPDRAEAILSVAKARQVEMIVMATRAAGAIGRTLHGSVADRVLRKSNQPVVVVPPAVARSHAAHRPFRKILLPLDSSQDALRMLDSILACDRAAGLQFVLFQAVKSEATGGYMMPVALPPLAAHHQPLAERDVIHAQRDQAMASLNAIASHLRLHRCEAEVRVVESAHPDYAIVTAAIHESVDFIAMTRSGLRGLSRWLIGSVADGVTRKSSVPVLIMAQ